MAVLQQLKFGSSDFTVKIVHFIINIFVKAKVQSDVPFHHVTLCIFFQARNIRSSEMAAIKIVKLDPGV